MNDLTVHASEGLEIIKESDFLSASDIGFLVENKSVFQELFENKTIWRSGTDMRVSVLNDVKFPDKAAKYRQCARECDAFHGYLIDLSFEFRRNKVKLKLLERRLENVNDPLEQELVRIDIEELQYQIRNQTKQASERVRELREWILLMSQLDDGTWDSSDLDKTQLLSYAQSFIKKYMINQDHVSGSERTNLIGLLVTSLRYCEELGVMTELRESLNQDENKFLDGLEFENK